MSETAPAPALQIDDLRPEAVLAAASRATGLDDYGDRSFVEGLGVLLDSLRAEGRLNLGGVAAQFQDMVRMLSNRLRFQRDLKAHPEILDEPIERPIVIIGLPRTGSSKLQRMIATDPGVQRLEVWRLMFPAPFSGNRLGSVGAAPDPRITLAEQIEAALTARYPGFMARHPMEAREPDEELWLLEMTFESPISSIKLRAPSHRAWIEGRPQRQPYAYMKSLLQYLQWQDGSARGRPWILKSPCHIGELPTLLELFPDATVVHCHRDPRTVITSFCSLLEITRKMNSDEVDLHELGADYNAYWGHETERGLVARRALGEDRVLDVYYDDIRLLAKNGLLIITACSRRHANCALFFLDDFLDRCWLMRWHRSRNLMLGLGLRYQGIHHL